MPFPKPNFERSFASHSKANCWSNKNEKEAKDVYKGSPEKYWFNCDDCPHEFQSALNGVTGSRKRWCPYCSNQRLCNLEEIDCQTCFEKTFASHPRSRQWSNRNRKTAKQVFKSSDSEKYWFVCDKCPHEFQKTCCDLINSDEENGCPYCAKSNGTLCNEKDCNYCVKNSFASEEKADYWNYTLNTKKPRGIRKFSDEYCWVNCNFCHHTFNAQLKTITKGQWCPFCCLPPKQLCSEEDCKECYEKRFTRHEKSKYWSSKNEESHIQVFICSGKSYWFDCKDCGRDFKMQISSITSKGTWCPYCVRKTEKKMLDFLQQHYTTIHQFRQEWCKNPETGNRLPFDFCIPELDIIIELDGLQHFIQVMNWRAPDIQQDLDYYKQVQANNNGYSVIRILQPDVYYDRYDWMTELKEIIERIRNSDTVENFYMCKNGEYAHF